MGGVNKENLVWSKTGAVNNKFETMNRCGNPNYGDSLMDM